MDLYKLPEGHPKSFPDGHRFSWIAFDSDDESMRVLFDCHHPKGPHFHVDNEATAWRSSGRLWTISMSYFSATFEKDLATFTRRIRT
jgi:hypothetical protein